ncbi:ammonia-forming cytochrome c nitrite reductase subunit c552 [Vibrio lentus]|nr:ammonia-forming cytochrome c nitrite reductase subunit c552 [Vibrio lentus]
MEERGEDGYFEGKWARLGNEIINLIGCSRLSRHPKRSGFKNGEPALKVTRPHVERAFETIGKKFDEQSRLDQQASVCAQCHVEYYFTGQPKVKFPGTKVQPLATWNVTMMQSTLKIDALKYRKHPC